MKNTGRTPFVFLGLIIVVLLSAVAISLYFLQKETILRQTVEVAVDELNVKIEKTEIVLGEAQKQIGVLEGKNKDADERINGLLDELEVEKGLREEVKKENQKLRDNLDAEAKLKIELRNKSSKDLDEVKNKLKNKLKSFTDAAVRHKGSVLFLQKKIVEFRKKNEELKGQIVNSSVQSSEEGEQKEILPGLELSKEQKVELDRIVVTPDAGKEGKVLNVDTDADFLIFDMGSRHGLQPGAVMSIYHGKKYLGDVRVTRVQEEMSAADFIPPFSSRKVHKNDQVVVKK